MKKALNTLIFLFLTFPIGVFVGLFFFILRIIGQTKILHYERFPHWERKLIVVSNHPSLLETVLVPSLFFHQYAVNPFAYAPINTPDSDNFYKRWYWAWARPVSIPIKRGNKIAELRSLYQIKKTLDQNRIVILFAEGGRTFRGKDGDFLYSTKGKKIRKLKDGIGWLVVKTRAGVLPIWVEGTDQVLPNHPTKLFCDINPRARITIKIGNLLRFRPSLRIGSAGKEITQKISDALLKLADEEG